MNEYCPGCGSQAPEQGRFCVTCGAEFGRITIPPARKDGRATSILITIGALLLLFAVVSNVNRTSAPPVRAAAAVVPKGRAPDVLAEKCVVLHQEFKIIDKSSYPYAAIVGTLKNACDKRLRYVSVSYKLFDKAGNIIGSTLANQADVDIGETWAFQSRMPGSTDRYKLDRIDARF